MIRRIIGSVLCFTLLFEQSGFAQSVSQNDFFAHSRLNGAFIPAHLRYVSYDENANNFKFLFDNGDFKSDGDIDLKDSISGPLSYFLIGITLPSESFWVNLRPDSPNNVMDDLMAQTDVGKIFLEADLQLKKDLAWFTTCSGDIDAKEYRRQLGKKSEELFGSMALAPSSCTRVWIDPGEIIIRENQNSAYVYKANLDVLTQEDHFGNSLTFEDKKVDDFNKYSSELIKKLILPKLVRQVNAGKEFAALRQVYYSLILAQWFKDRFLQRNGAGPRFINSKILSGLNSKHPWYKQDYFEQYQKSFQTGEYRFNESVSLVFGEMVTTYSSGGISLGLSIPSLASAGMISTNGFVTSIGGDSEMEDALASGQAPGPALISASVKFDPNDPLGNVIVQKPNIEEKLFSENAMNDGGLVLKQAKQKLGAVELKKHSYLIMVELLLAGFFILGFFVDAGRIFYSYGLFAHSLMEAFVGHPLPSLNEYFQVSALSFIAFNALFGLLKSPAIKAKSRLLSVLSILAGFTLFGTVPLSISLMGLEKYFNLQLAVSPYVIEAIALLGGGFILLGNGLIKKAHKGEYFVKKAKKKLRGAKLNKPIESGIQPAQEPVIEDNLISEIAATDLESGKILAQWESLLASPGDLTEVKRADIMNMVRQIINLHVFSEDALSNIKEPVRIYRKVVLLSNETIEKLFKQLQNSLSNLDEKESKVILFNIKELIQVTRYGLHYCRAMDFATNLRMMGGYFLPDDHIGERSGVMGAIRLIWGMRVELKQSERQFLEQVDMLIALGNQIEPHLYLYPEKLKTYWKGYLQTFYSPHNGGIVLGMEAKWGTRKMLTRFVPLILALRPLVVQIADWAGFHFVGVSMIDAIVSTAFGVGLSISLSWLFLQSGNKSKFYESQMRTADIFTERLKVATEALEIPTHEDYSGCMLAEEYLSTVASWKQEIEGHGGSADLILVLSNDKQNENYLRSFLSDRQGVVTRKDIPVIFLSGRNMGSGMAVMNAADYFSSEAFEKFKTDYPSLKGKSYETMRTIVLLAGRDDVKPMTTELQLPAIEGLGLPPTPLEWTLFNGYKATQSLAKENRGGMAILFGDGFLVSSIKRTGDITLLGSWCSYEQMQKQGLGFLVIDAGRSHKIRKLYEKVALNTIKNKLERTALSKMFDFTNIKKRQALAFSGGIILSFGSTDKYKDFLSLIKKARSYVVSNSKEWLPISLTRDILVPLIMKENGENPFTYLAARAIDGIRSKKIRDFYLGLFDIWVDNENAKQDNGSGKIDFQAFATHTASYVRIDGSAYQQSLLESLRNELRRVTGISSGQLSTAVSPKPRTLLGIKERRGMIKDFFLASGNKSHEFTIRDILEGVFIEHFFGDRTKAPSYAVLHQDLENLVKEGFLAKELKRDHNGNINKNHYRLSKIISDMGEIGSNLSPDNGPLRNQSDDTAMQYKDGGYSLSNASPNSRQSVIIPSLGTGGIDFSTIRISSAPNRMEKSRQLKKMGEERRQIKQMLESGSLPPIPLVTDYVEATIESADSSAQAYEALKCIADILKLEEKLVIPTEIEIKRLLMLIEEHYKPIEQ